jgi:DnaJ-class molecular chaperone
MKNAAPVEEKCQACNGTGHQAAKQPSQADRRIYPPPCKECSGKGRITKS